MVAGNEEHKIRLGWCGDLTPFVKIGLFPLNPFFTGNLQIRYHVFNQQNTNGIRDKLLLCRVKKVTSIVLVLCIRLKLGRKKGEWNMLRRAKDAKIRNAEFQDGLQ
ncbi:hypothetical protein [Paenibacillus sp. Marseille-Q4541]|uniref:hypothetical protein n=1 Tax=Paenibacillus sp. Marseille-Q4541 TaxID=2831522 RepID=UPI001BAA22F7|nr:hypothetical protein [Paenibacillus sp. Marseille-Q4541]